MSRIPPGVRSWAVLPGPATVLAVARAKAEAGRLGTRSILAQELTDAARIEVGRLLGTSWQASGAPLRTADLRRCLDSYGVVLQDLLTDIGGPLQDLPAVRAAAAHERATDAGQARDILTDLWRDHLGVAGPAPAPVQPLEGGLGTRRPELDGAGSRERLPPDEPLDSVLRACLPTAGGGAASARANELQRVFQQVPRATRWEVAGPIPEQELLAVVAARAFGDAHALDRERALGRAAARLAAHLQAARSGEPPEDPLSSAQAWRDAWSGVGIACDEVSSLVLVLGLPLRGPSPAAAITTAAGVEPVWLTLRSLRQPPVPAPGVGEVFVCENPSVIEAATDRLGSGSAPLICTFGRPSLAATILLRTLAQAGVRLRIGADGDATGTAIVTELLALAPGSIPWRLQAGVYEEQILDDLLADLGGADRLGRTTPDRCASRAFRHRA